MCIAVLKALLIILLYPIILMVCLFGLLLWILFCPIYVFALVCKISSFFWSSRYLALFLILVLLPDVLLYLSG